MSTTKSNGPTGQNGSVRRRRRPSSDDEDDEDGQYADATADARKPKRMRPSVGPDDLDDVDDVEEDVNETYYSTNDGLRAENENNDEDEGEGEEDDDDGGGTAAKPTFQPGAIVRVFVENFVTYERAEFNPGPSLNMVIGPNGTGKSSLVCAICLGLGFHSNVLGRAAAFGDFVKHGRAHAVVEIELQKRPGGVDRRNLVVRLRIAREDNSRKFWLNGREAPLRRVQEVVQAMRIQVDNLCQFLPQDRVAEFAGLSAVDLLAKTLEAAAPVEMKAWQAQLKQVYRSQKEAQHQRSVDAERLRILEGRHQAQQADVERFREREEIERTLADLAACRPLVRFYEAKQKYAELSSQRKAATHELRALQNRLGPTLEAVNQKQAYQRRLEAGLENRKALLQHAERRAARALAGIERADEQVREAEDLRKTQTESIDKKKKEIAAARQKITALEARLKNKPQEFVAADWNMKIREKEHQRAEIEAEKSEILAESNSIKGQGNRLNMEKQQIEREIAALESQRGQQVSLLKKFAPEVARGLQWLEENSHKFSKEVFGPPMVTCSVKDLRYSNLIQSLLQTDDFLCFTTQSVQDHKKLSDQFYEVMGLSVTIRTCTTPVDSFRSPLSPEELSAMGFQGTAIDFLEGPEPVLAMLCVERRLHASPVSTEKPRQDQYEMITNNDKISTWAAKDQMYRVNRRREYGAHAVSTAVRDVRPGRFWTQEQADMSEKTELQRQLSEINGKLHELQENLREVRARAAGPTERSAEVDKEIEHLREAKAQLQSEYSRWCALPEKIQMENNTLSRIREEHADLVSQRLQQISLRDDLILQKARAVLRHAEQVARLRDAYYEFVNVQVRLLEAGSDFDGLRDRNKHLAELLAEKQKALERLQEDMRAQRQAGKDALAAAEDVAEEGSERSEALHELARGKTTEDLENEVAAEQAKLELTRVVDVSVLDAFRKRAREIAQLQAAMAAHADGDAALAAQIAALRGKWEPRLDALIARINDAFSYNFEQINCAGEVSVHKDEDDFDKWAIDIRVKFRENEELQKLDQHRQSGGERAVSTIFYLMSLQGMAQAPFRVVDEINQGMDPRNERMMHERMVEIACHEHTSQYFLITPKLLPGLRYDENMTVLCIASGQHVPNYEAKLDFRKCMQIQRRLLAAA